MTVSDPVRRAIDLVYIVDERAGADERHIRDVLEAGVTAVWLRDHALDGAQLFRVAQQLRDRCHAHDVRLMVGGRADVACAVAADGVHLGSYSPPADRVRSWFPGWMGVSCHDERELRRAQRAGADYVTLSPVYDVPGKGAPIGVSQFERLRGTVQLPVVALGGIDPSNAAAVRGAGADGVAVIRALREAADPVATARALREHTPAV